MRTTDKYVFFYGGPFSQWFRCKFTVDGIKFNCTEQFMMAGKARLFKDDEMQAKIMESTDPHEQKMKYGRNVRNFVVDVWNAHCKEIVYEANCAKFSQNEELKKV